ncbi:hypothetical protein ACPVPU_00040 [Sphingomonas sp. CJ99]
MMAKPNEIAARKVPWWLYLIGPVLGVGTSRLSEHFLPPLSDGARHSIVVAAAILIAVLLTYAIYRFSRF